MKWQRLALQILSVIMVLVIFAISTGQAWASPKKLRLAHHTFRNAFHVVRTWRAYSTLRIRKELEQNSPQPARIFSLIPNERRKKCCSSRKIWYKFTLALRNQVSSPKVPTLKHLRQEQMAHPQLAGVAGYEHHEVYQASVTPSLKHYLHTLQVFRL